MIEEKFQIFDARLKTPFSLIIAGPSNCGKTSFVANLLFHADRLIDNKFDYILWFYGESIPNNEMLNTNKDIHFIEGLPETFDDLIDSSKTGLAIFDDLMKECGKNQLITDFFTRRSHHENVSIIFITQNLFHEGRERKKFTKNATYLTIFNSPLDQSMAYSLARKLMPKGQKTFIEIYNHAVDKPHGYLFIDGHQQTPKSAMFRSDIFDDVQHVFIPQKK